MTSGLAVVPGREAAAAAAAPDWLTELEASRRGSDVAPVPWQASSAPAPLATNVGMEPAKFDFPRPARWDVQLADAAAAADGRPVRVKPKTSVRAGDTLAVEVLDRSAAQRVGASGFVFKVTGDRAVAVELSIDYSGFANAYGAGYADRLRVVALAACALAQPVPAGCRTTGAPLPARNDLDARTLTVDVADVSKTSLFAVISAVGGDLGTFAATPLSLSGSWQVAPGSGAFTYSYPVDVPAPAAGTAPSVSLGYSSAAIDGLTLARNTQASPTGTGWSDFANAFIERRYEPCIRNFPYTSDLCWMTDNATISLGGVSGSLIPVNAAHTEWRVQSDPGWKIERLTGAPYTTIHQGQYWRATGPDGTQYFFGYGHMPGQRTNSILAVNVIADNVGEPCDVPGPDLEQCDQGWRWYLDRVVDPDGNVQSLVYERQENWFAAIGGWAGHIGNSRYDRAAMLKTIYYGGRGWDSATYAARITFGLEWRCAYLVAACPAATAGHTGFPDVPTDLICAQGAACTVYAPSFFNARRYSHIRTDVKIGAEWKPVAQHNIIHSFGDGLNGVAYKLQLEELQHAAIAFGKLNAYPTTKFDYVYNDNRADHGGNVTKAMRHNRLNKITNPFGGVISVSYFRNRGCSSTYNPYPRWDLNDMDCFPQSIRDGGALRTGVFHKYLVRQVVETAGLSSPTVSTTYAYEGTPAWAFDSTAFARDEDESGWSIWRGYGTALITKGSAKTRIRVFRGWDGDPMLVLDGGNWVPLGRRNVQVAELGRPTVTYADHSGLAGRALEEQQLGTLSGVVDTVVLSRRHEYERRTTFDVPPEYRYDPEWLGVSATTEAVFGAAGVSRERRSQTTYNAYFQPTTTLELGWLDVTGDERCSITTYADNPAAGLTVYPAVNKKVAGDCASTQVLSLSETYYDTSTTLGAPPTRGNPTRHRTLIGGTRWAETTTEYDAMGRPTRATDANGGFTTTTYQVTAGAPTTQIPTRTTVTNALGQQVVTDFHPEFGIPKRQQDANGNVTEHWYDEFGRMTAVWLPTEPVDFAEASWKFSYDIPNRAVRSQRLVSDVRTGAVVFEDGWVIYDGFWRERQSQGLSAVSGKALVSETTYDDRGQLRDEMVEQAITGTPGTYLSGGSAWLNRTRHSYDELGREIRREWLRGSTVAHATATSFGGDTVTVTGPDGRQVREQVDAFGRTIAVGERDGQSWVTSSYVYDLGDRLTSVTDPAGNRITYTYNLAGWRTSQQDPNRGSATFTYDDAGNQASVTDALGNQIHTRYDVLGRQIERRAGSPTGTLLASWTYDTAPGGKGRLHRETTHTSSGAWISETLGYDIKGRPTGSSFVVPAGIPGLSGTYTITQTYDRADRIRSVNYPAMGGLPAETVTMQYNNLGLPTRMAGLEEYVWGAAYDDRGRKVSAGIGPRPGGATWMAKRWTYDVDQQVNGAESLVNGAVVADHEMVFDLAGNLAEKLTRQGALAWRECFGYDDRSRLTSAHTVAVSTACAGGTPGTGDRPYSHSYQYSPDGKLTTRVENGVTTAYTYPAAGAARPHAPSRVGTTAYTWDARGNLASRGSETFSWDVQGLLQSVTGVGGTTSFVYDASGQRVLRRTPDGRATLYVAGHEITANTTGSVLSAVRPYSFNGQLVATRTAGGAVEYLVSDAAGSVEMGFASNASAPSVTRAYQPYGLVRGQTGDAATDRGFLGQIEDASTGLSYLNARYYDTRVGVFISPDALYNTAKVKSLNPYSYSSNNPATFADPSGLYSSYTWGLEVENSRLRAQNKELIAHIGRLGDHIEHLQDVIRQQQKVINKLTNYVRALEAEIARQASIIRQLQARVAYLERVVVAQQREISRLRYVVARQQQIIRYQAGVIRYQAGVIGYYKGVVNVLGFRLWGGTPQYSWVMNSIHSFRGIPAGAFNYDRISILQATVAARDATIGRLSADLRGARADVAQMERYRTVWRDLAIERRGTINDLDSEISDLEASNDDLRDRLEDAETTDWKDWLSDGAGFIPIVGDAWDIQNLWQDFGCDSGLFGWWADNMPNPFGAPPADATC